jgi:hypothetical protein
MCGLLLPQQAGMAPRATQFLTALQIKQGQPYTASKHTYELPGPPACVAAAWRSGGST